MKITEKIGHKAEADDALAMAELRDTTYEERANILARAQVHATLYLAEQQRVANLIAAREMVNPKYKSWNGNNPPEDLYPITAETIFEGLGL